MKTKRNQIISYLLFLLIAVTGTAGAQVTKVSVTIPRALVQVDPMIYGQMLENVNDSMIYGGTNMN